MFPGCKVDTTVSFTPGVLLCYWQLATLGIWLTCVLFFACYTLCWKNWSSDDEDNVNLDELTKDKDNGFVWRERAMHYKQVETQFFKCPKEHMCLRTFGLPDCYSSHADADAYVNVNCSICDSQGIQEQRYFAYFTYCKECTEGGYESYNVCMKCTGRWKDGIEMTDLSRHSTHE